MKKLLKMFCLVTVLFSICACTGGKQEAKTYDLAGKTFYDNSTNSGSEPSQLWLGKDGSFVLKDNYSDGFDEIAGKWSLSENVLTLEVENSSNYSRIIFEVKDDNNLSLKTSLLGSNGDALYSTNKPAAGSPSQVTSKDYKAYYNANQDSASRSHIEIHDDGSFSLVDRGTNGVQEVNGLWGLTDKKEVYMFSNFDEFKDASGNMVYNFEMAVIDENTLCLMENLTNSKAGDYFTVDGKMPENVSGIPAFGFTTTTWVHEPFWDINEAYLPTLTIATDYSFKLVENLGAGMGTYSGYCQHTDDGCWICDVTDINFSGFAGDDVKQIRFSDYMLNDLRLETNLCFSSEGDIFLMKTGD